MLKSLFKSMFKSLKLYDHEKWLKLKYSILFEHELDKRMKSLGLWTSLWRNADACERPALLLRARQGRVFRFRLCHYDLQARMEKRWPLQMWSYRKTHPTNYLLSTTSAQHRPWWGKSLHLYTSIIPLDFAPLIYYICISNKGVCNGIHHCFYCSTCRCR